MKQTGEKEVIVCGVIPDTNPYFKHVRFFECKEWAEQGYTSKMRDKAFMEAKGDYIVAMDDDIILGDGFQESIGCEDVQIPVCECFPYGGRFWDWAVLDHPELGHTNIDYDVPYSEYNYLSGQCFIINASIAKMNLHKSELKFHEEDDVDYGKKLQQAGLKFTMNPDCKCVHFDARYVSADNKVFRRGN